MAENKKNNNFLYIALVIAGILLLLIPFFLFDVGSSINGTGHLTRFGLHILAFVGALFAGSLLSTGVANATSSAATMKVVAISSAAVIGTAVTINTVQYVSNPTPPTLAALADSVSMPEIPQTLNDTTSTEYISISDGTAVTPVNNDDTLEQESLPKEIVSGTTTDNQKNKTDSKTSGLSQKTDKPKTVKAENSTVDKSNTANTIALSESCQSFQVSHGSKQLDRKLGLSIYDPNKTIKFNNDCGCILKEATMSLSRKDEVLEQKIQNGNFINLHSFKDLQADDKLSVEIRKATCKDNQGVQALYTFPKPILTVILISDHKEFETASEIKANKKNPSTTPVDNSIKTNPKDKVEDEMNKYGN